MAKSYQLVAWTDHGRLRMIPSQISAFLLDATDEIDRLAGRIRHGTCHEVNDTLAVSRAYEKLGLWLLELGQMKEAFGQFAQAALCCGASDSTWTDTEWGEELCKPLRGRFFVLFRQCKDLVRTYPQLRYSWEKSGLQQRCDFITSPDRMIEKEWEELYGNVREARSHAKALNFGKDEAFRRRRV